VGLQAETETLPHTRRLNLPSFAQFCELDLALANQLADKESFEKGLTFEFKTVTAKHLIEIENRNVQDSCQIFGATVEKWC
jgi:hypothetical protein